MIRHIVILLLLSLCCPTPAMCTGDIVFATEGDLPPYNWTDKNGEPAGFDSDIAMALCKAMDANCKVVVEAWEFLPVGLVSGKFDVIISDLDKSPEREGLMLFTDEYISKTASFVAKKGRFSGRGPGNLAGRKIAAMANTVYEDYLEEEYAAKSECSYTETTMEAFRMLANGEVDVVLTETPVAKVLLHMPAGSGFEIIGQSAGDDDLLSGSYIAVRKDEESLRDSLNKALAEIRQNGEYQRIYDKYFKTGPQSVTPEYLQGIWTPKPAAK